MPSNSGAYRPAGWLLVVNGQPPRGLVVFRADDIVYLGGRSCRVISGLNPLPADAAIG
jgi:hypothetical protein